LAARLAGTFWDCGEELAYLRFEPTTMTMIVLSAAMLAMGRTVIHEQRTAEVTYHPDDRLTATAIRVDTFEGGDRTPPGALEEHYTARRDGDTLTFAGAGWSEPWTCTRSPR